MIVFAGQELKKHADRDACEISVSVHISSNLDECWPFKIKSVQGEEYSLCLEPTLVCYIRCERPHWRDPLQSRYKRKRDRLKIGSLEKKMTRIIIRFSSIMF